MKILITVVLLCFGCVLYAQDVTQPPSTGHAVYTAVGRGVQIYACQPGGAWVLQEPQADLFDAGTKQRVGTHSKGPTWTWTDGSAITGKVLKQQPSKDSIPWLLLETHSSGTAGALSNITYVRRSDTQGGTVPAAGAVCGTNNTGELLRVPYQATYTFYTAN